MWEVFKETYLISLVMLVGCLCAIGTTMLAFRLMRFLVLWPTDRVRDWWHDYRRGGCRTTWREW